MAELMCSSCKRNVSNLRATRFSCPQCGKTQITRCAHCRSNAVQYDCPECNFKGPN